MTEKEVKAIKWMKCVKDDAVVTLDHIAKNEPKVSPMLYAGRKEKAETIINGFEELEQYRAIGTVEECREARERRMAKKPERYGTARQGLDNDGHSIRCQEDCYICPNCEAFLGYVFDCKDENYQDDYCRNCGQSISWEGE